MPDGTIRPVQGASRKCVVGLGELLWDLLPTGPQLGGAVSNFAVVSGLLGDYAVCASRVGQDDLGRQARARLERMPVDASCLQTDPHSPTGTVSVAFKNGQPEYMIHAPAAWDFLELTPPWSALARRADAVCFGTLAQRAPVSAQAIAGFLAATSLGCVRIFDVNLRPPFYSAEIVERSLRLTTILKMNDAELPLVSDLLDLAVPGLRPRSEPIDEALLTGARALLKRFPISLVCVTMGARGSLLVTREEADRHHGIPVRVADPVGAGDAFTAALAHAYLRRRPLKALNEIANRWGSWVASQPGAMPTLPVPSALLPSASPSDE